MKNYSVERKCLRLSEYDYSSDGYYFVTICTQNRENFFGDIKNNIMGLNNVGCIIAQCWQNITKHFFDIQLYEWVVMPNHFHGIVVIEQHVGDRHACPLHVKQIKPQYKLLPVIIGSFKSATTKYINQLNPYTGFKWQRSYYDHIIRNEKSLDNICNYIRNNPPQWEWDMQNQKNQFSNLEIKKHYDNLFN